MTDTATTVESPHLTFSGGLPGFPDVRTFQLLNTELAQQPFSIMRCIEDAAIEFVVVPALLFFPSYSPEIDDATAERIGLQSAEDALLLVILTVGEETVDITANLLGPVIVNQTNNEAAQAVLAGQDFNLRQPLFSDDIRSALSD
jgi:flagellar assembly factor FliW